VRYPVVRGTLSCGAPYLTRSLRLFNLYYLFYLSYSGAQLAERCRVSRKDYALKI